MILVAKKINQKKIHFRGDDELKTLRKKVKNNFRNTILYYSINQQINRFLSEIKSMIFLSVFYGVIKNEDLGFSII